MTSGWEGWARLHLSSDRNSGTLARLSDARSPRCCHSGTPARGRAGRWAPTGSSTPASGSARCGAPSRRRRHAASTVPLAAARHASARAPASTSCAPTRAGPSEPAATAVRDPRQPGQPRHQPLLDRLIRQSRLSRPPPRSRPADSAATLTPARRRPHGRGSRQRIDAFPLAHQQALAQPAGIRVVRCAHSGPSSSGARSPSERIGRSQASRVRRSAFLRQITRVRGPTR
jgi:hypothetical protein